MRWNNITNDHLALDELKLREHNSNAIENPPEVVEFFYCDRSPVNRLNAHRICHSACGKVSGSCGKVSESCDGINKE